MFGIFYTSVYERIIELKRVRENQLTAMGDPDQPQSGMPTVTFSYAVTASPCHWTAHATMLYLLGLNQTRSTIR